MRDRIKRIPAGWYLSGWLLLALFGLCASDAALLGSEDLFLLLPLGAAAVLLFSRDRSPREWFQKANRGTAVPALLFAALTLLMLPIGRFLSGPLFSFEGSGALSGAAAWRRGLCLAWNWVGLLGAVLLSVFVCWYAALDAARRRGEAGLPQTAPEPPVFLGIYRWTFLIAVVAIACVFSASPGLFDQYDQQAIWNHAMSGSWEDGHPVTYLFFVRLCALLIPSRRMVSLVSLAGWIFISNQAIGLLNPLHPRAGKWFAILTSIAFLPMLYIATIIKDVPFSIALIALSLQLLRILQGKGRPGWRFAGVGVWMFFAISFRHDGLFPILLTAIALLVYFWRKRRKLVRPLTIAVLGVFVVHLLLTEVLAFRILDVQRNKTYSAFGTPLYLLAALANSGREIEPEDVAKLEELMPLSDWAASQQAPNSRYTVDHASRPWGVPGDRIGRINPKRGLRYCLLAAKYFVKYPGVMTEAFFTVNSLAWELTTPHPDAEPERISFDLSHLDEYEPGALAGFSFTGISALTMPYAHFLETTPILRELLVRGGASLLCLLFGCFVLWRKGRRAELLASLPVFGAWFGHFLMLCAQMPRYVLPIRIWAVFIVLYAVFAPDMASGAPQPRAEGQERALPQA